MPQIRSLISEPGAKRRTSALLATGLLPDGTAQGDTGRETVHQICTQRVAGSNPAVSTKVVGEAPPGASNLLLLSLGRGQGEGV